MPSRDEVFGLIESAIGQVQAAAGRDVTPISTRTELFREIADFDSLNALEVLVQVSGSLDVEIPDKVLVADRKRGPLTVGQLADRIAAQVGLN